MKVKYFTEVHQTAFWWCATVIPIKAKGKAFRFLIRECIARLVTSRGGLDDTLSRSYLRKVQFSVWMLWKLPRRPVAQKGFQRDVRQDKEPREHQETEVSFFELVALWRWQTDFWRREQPPQLEDCCVRGLHTQCESNPPAIMPCFLSVQHCQAVSRNESRFIRYVVFRFEETPCFLGCAALIRWPVAICYPQKPLLAGWGAGVQLETVVCKARLWWAKRDVHNSA